MCVEVEGGFDHDFNKACFVDEVALEVFAIAALVTDVVDGRVVVALERGEEAVKFCLKLCFFFFCWFVRVLPDSLDKGEELVDVDEGDDVVVCSHWFLLRVLHLLVCSLALVVNEGFENVFDGRFFFFRFPCIGDDSNDEDDNACEDEKVDKYFWEDVRV